jgi:hypothetical protein
MPYQLDNGYVATLFYSYVKLLENNYLSETPRRLLKQNIKELAKQCAVEDYIDLCDFDEWGRLVLYSFVEWKRLVASKEVLDEEIFVFREEVIEEARLVARMAKDKDELVHHWVKRLDDYVSHWGTLPRRPSRAKKNLP